MAGVRKTQAPKAWMPAVGTIITAHLPNETIRATVFRHIDTDTLEALLNVQNPSNTIAHGYRLNKKVILHRQPLSPMGVKWEAEVPE